VSKKANVFIGAAAGMFGAGLAGNRWQTVAISAVLMIIGLRLWRGNRGGK